MRFIVETIVLSGFNKNNELAMAWQLLLSGACSTMALPAD
jgi:uncharacterized membrane protein